MPARFPLVEGLFLSVKSRVIRPCAYCGDELSLKTSVFANNKNGRFFCCTAHMGLWRSANFVGAAHPTFIERVTVKCEICGKKKRMHASMARAREFFLCSGTCRGEWNRRHFTGKRTRVVVRCFICGTEKEITPSHSKLYKKFFCKLTCRSAFNSERSKGRNNPNWHGGGRSDPIMCSMNHRMASGMRVSLSIGKSGRSWEKLIGVTVYELREHLDRTMPAGSTWDDFLLPKGHPRKLEIDHIRPISSFKFSSPEDKEFQQCWALNNLQLLTHPANMEKGAEYLPF